MMNKNILAINKCLDAWLETHDQAYLTPPEANDILDKAGLLKDRKERAEIELRKLLRSRLFPHAYQIGRRWIIPHSGSYLVEHTMLDNPKVNPTVTTKTAFEEHRLMDEVNFKRVSECKEDDIPNDTGLYVIRIDRIEALPYPFSEALNTREHNILYVGITKESLRERLWKSELHCRKPATFFRSIGAILGYRPLPLKNSSRNYKFSIQDQTRIEEWMSKHLLINFYPKNDCLDNIESILIEKYRPIINITEVSHP